jgi:CHAT domain-containing protein
VGEDAFLAVGGVEYASAEKPAGEGPATAPLFANALRGLRPLPGTVLETEQAAAIFRQSFAGDSVVTLAGSDASEKSVAAQLAKKPRFVHLATHGFFAPAATPSALAAHDREGPLATQPRGVSPWLLSGLVLSPEASSADLAGDGILTAEELNALDLAGIDLVVLSACETGLGNVAGGEGVLGLQRGFHVAGARTVVTSLWKVDDAATSLLMQAFYDNLWNKKLPKLEALRQAQLGLLKTPSALDKRRDLLAQQFVQRGIALEDAPAKPLPAASAGDRTHPRYWAAFVLSGDAFHTAAASGGPP